MLQSMEWHLLDTSRMGHQVAAVCNPASDLPGLQVTRARVDKRPLSRHMCDHGTVRDKAHIQHQAPGNRKCDPRCRAGLLCLRSSRRGHLSA